MKPFLGFLVISLLGCSNPPKSIPFSSCEEKFDQCQMDFFELLKTCIADQVSMREFEQCPNFPSFIEECRGE